MSFEGDEINDEEEDSYDEENPFSEINLRLLKVNDYKPIMIDDVEDY